MCRRTQLIRMIVKGTQAPIVTVPLPNDLLLFYEPRYLAFARIPCLWVTYGVQNKHPFLEISVRQFRESVKTL
jgi:hypothetical protein